MIFRRLTSFRFSWAILIVAASAGSPLGAGGPSRRDADQLRQKLDLIISNAAGRSPAPRRTPVTEAEVNAYLLLDAKDQIPAGVVEPYVSILGDGRVAGRAIVDLDEVSRQGSSGGLFDPKRYLTGRLPVAATGILRTTNGVGRFELESAQISGITVPKAVLQELVSHYSRSPENPNGLSLDAPFDLPAKIRQIEVGRGEAVVIQ